MVMVANTEMVAPPMTHWGMVVSREANLGTSPATSRMRPPGEDRPVDDPVDGDDAHVLAVGGGGQAAEEGAQNAHDALAHDAAGELLVGGHAVHAAHGGGGEVADGLYRIDHVDDAQGHTGGRDELDVKGHGPGQGDPGRAAHPGQIHDAQEIGNDIACQYANEDGASLVMPLVKWLRKTTTARVIRATAQLLALPNHSEPAPPAMYFTAVG